MKNDDAMAALAAIAAEVGEFYERHPYPPPVDDLQTYGRLWDEHRRRAESHLFWPDELFRADRSVLVAGCGTAQAAHYAVRWPHARVVGIDVSAGSIAFEQQLKRTHGLDNLELAVLPVESAAKLREQFDHIVCTGVLHHLTDPTEALRALKYALAPTGAMHLMVYAPYGRAGVYLLQEYCRRLAVERTAQEIHDLRATLKGLSADHPIHPLLTKSPDFVSEAGLADALLHPNDRAYSVPQFMELLTSSELEFGRWVRQAPYLASCGAPATTPHAARLQALSPADQYAAVELFRGAMARHSAVVYHPGCNRQRVDFAGDAWLQYVPIRLPDTIAVHDRLPPGAAAVLINRGHTYTDLYWPIDAEQERLLEAIDGRRKIGDMGPAAIDKPKARRFFEDLWRWDQAVFDTTGTQAPA